MSLSEWWRATRELFRLSNSRPYSYWVLAGCFVVTVLSVLGNVLVWPWADARRWYFVTVTSPVAMYYWGLLLWLVRRVREQCRNDPS